MAGAAFQTLRGGRQGALGQLLGAGGQGAVYASSLGSARFAVKWYHPSYTQIDTGLRARLSRAIEQGPPNDAFLWPIDLIQIEGQVSFGYLMRLRDTEYAGMNRLIARPPQRIEPTLAARARICVNIAQSFLELHANGFCYQDVNFGNVFFHPDSGDILICDNDNVDVDGAPASVFGTRKFMAPEIVRREAMPSTKSDLFSMAVLFFYVMHAWHPLDGKREAAVDIMDSAAETLLYGTEPLFIFDPVDTANGPLAGMHEPIEARWRALPTQLRALFVRAFTTGLRHPGSRVQEAEWRAAFAALAGATYACNSCGFEHSVEAGPDHGPAGPPSCFSCGGTMPLPAVLSVGRTQFCLTHGARIPLHLLAPERPFDMAACGATIEAHPTRPGIFGLQNHGLVTWRTRLQDSSDIAVPPGSTMRLVDGATVDFGTTRGRLTVPGATAPNEAVASMAAASARQPA